MIPDNVLSSSLVYSSYIPPADLTLPLGVDYELGGVDLSDPSKGLMYQPWTARVHGVLGEAGTSVWIEAANHSEFQLFALDGITHISLSFDQNMHPCIAYTAAGVSHFWWYDPSVQLYKTLDLVSGVTNPYCTLDDKRALAVTAGNTDILLMYIREASLCLRQQRDKYATEYILFDNLASVIFAPSLIKDSMNIGSRIQIKIQGNFFD